MAETIANPMTSAGQSADRRRGVEQILNLIRPAVQADGGDVELLDITPAGVVRVRFHGACVGCPDNTRTLEAVIQRQLVEKVPGVTGVQAVEG